MIQAEIDRSLDSQISYNLQVFHDGKLFEHEITSRNCPYDIVILDIELGNSSKSGIELAREINCLNPETQIIFVTSLWNMLLMSTPADILILFPETVFQN